MARPSKYDAEIKPKLKFLRALVNAGFSNEDIQQMLGIANDTFYQYKKKYKEFSECFEKENIAQMVENTYVNRLLGRYKAEKEVYEPDNKGVLKLVRKERYEIPFNDGAYKHYLATIWPDKWRDKATEESDIVKQFMDAVVNVSRKSKGPDDGRTDK